MSRCAPRFAVGGVHAGREHDSSRYRDLVTLRRRVLRIPLGLDFAARQLAEERGDIHIAAYLDGELVGCVALRAVDEHGAVRETVMRFCEKAGYVATGEAFMEVTIPYWVMIKPLATSDWRLNTMASVIDAGD